MVLHEEVYRICGVCRPNAAEENGFISFWPYFRKQIAVPENSARKAWEIQPPDAPAATHSTQRPQPPAVNTW